jgi:hypothetical protein
VHAQCERPPGSSCEQPSWTSLRERTDRSACAALRVGGSCPRNSRFGCSAPIAVLVSSFGVYVIQLRSCDDKSVLGALYVGSSWYPPSERFRQHDEGYETGSAALRGQCRRLRPELYLDLPWHWDRQTIIDLEHDRARRLAEAGFQVRCDGRIDSVRPALRTPFTLEELQRVSDQFEEIVRGLVAGAKRPLRPDDIVRALRWTHSEPSVDELISVPNEYVGRFSHVTEQAVHDLAYRTLHEHPLLTSHP